MENTKLVDSLKLPLKSYNDLLIAFNHMLTNDLEDYLNHFIAPFPGDWPMQFSMRQQLVYNNISVSLADACKNVVPLIGSLHISLNSRECVFSEFPQHFLRSLFLPLRRKGQTSKETKTVASIPTS